MAPQGLATQATKETTPAIRTGEPSDEIKQLFDSVAQRAFEIFQSNGRTFGHDVEDWLEAERELFHPAHIDVSESAEGFRIRAEVPGFSAKELEVNVDGRRLTISGKRQTREEKKEKKTIYSESCSNQVLRVVDLPAEINVNEVAATLNGGVLELEVPKAGPAKRVPIATKPV
jgi:HSP20 family protein